MWCVVWCGSRDARFFVCLSDFHPLSLSVRYFVLNWRAIKKRFIRIGKSEYWNSNELCPLVPIFFTLSLSPFIDAALFITCFIFSLRLASSLLPPPCVYPNNGVGVWYFRSEGVDNFKRRPRVINAHHPLVGCLRQRKRWKFCKIEFAALMKGRECSINS